MASESWEQEITELMDEASKMAVRYDEQELTSVEQTRSRNNMGIGSSASLISDSDYAIILNY